jgi:hypothetical protein
MIRVSGKNCSEVVSMKQSKSKNLLLILSVIYSGSLALSVGGMIVSILIVLGSGMGSLLLMGLAYTGWMGWIFSLLLLIIVITTVSIYWVGYKKIDGPSGLRWSKIVLIMGGLHLIFSLLAFEFFSTALSLSIFGLAFFAYQEKRNETGRPLSFIQFPKRNPIPYIGILASLLGLVGTSNIAYTNLKNYETIHYSYSVGKSELTSVVLVLEFILLLSFVVLVLNFLRLKMSRKIVAIFQLVLSVVNIISAYVLHLMFVAEAGYFVPLKMVIFVPEDYLRAYKIATGVISILLILSAIQLFIPKKKEKL